MWFTENPWPPIFILGAAACVFVGIWWTQRRGAWLIGALACLVGSIVIYSVEKSIVTERERLEQHIVELTTAFRKGDQDKTLAFFSPQAPLLKTLVLGAIKMVEVDDDLAIKDVAVTVYNEASQADTHFRANGTISVLSGNYRGHTPSRWLLRWQKEAGEWKIVEVHRLDTLKDEELPIFEPRM